MGIEPTSKAWEAFVLPLNYTRNCNLTTQPGKFFARSGGRIPRAARGPAPPSSGTHC